MLKSILFVVALATLAHSFAVDVNNFDSEFGTRIIQGENATRGQFPYYVYLKIHKNTGSKSSCGASLISHEWIVTAAHCLNGGLGGEIHAGSLRLADENEIGREIIPFTSDNIHVHPNYGQRNVQNDIALLKSPKTISFSEYIKPINLDCQSTKKLNVIVIGNGYLTSNSMALADILQWTALYTVPVETCLNAYPSLGNNHPGLLCAKGFESRSACSGDSGGPLIFKESGSLKRPVLLGVVSFGSGRGCHLGYPQGYTDVQYYFPWIYNVTGIPLPKCEE